MARFIYVCPECGSRDTQAPFWVDLNSRRDAKNGQRATIINESDDEYWCETCQDHLKRICLVDSRTRFCTEHKCVH